MTRNEAIRILTDLFGQHPDEISDDLVDEFLEYPAFALDQSDKWGE